MAKHIAFGQAINDAERWAFELLRQQLPEGYLVLTNLELTTHCGQQMEVDALVVGGWGIYVVDVKGYIGCLDASANTWSLDGRAIDNSLAKTNYIAKVLASKLKHKIPVGVYAPWCQGMVFLTGRKGEDILLHKSEGSLSIYTPQQIVSALTNKWGITAPHKHKVTEQQKTYVLDTIGQVAVVEQRNNRIHDFEKKKCLFQQNGLEIWEANYNPGDWQASWLLKILTPSCFDNDAQYTKQEQQLRHEFTLFQQLSGCSGVPYTAPLIQDGEQLILPIKMPRGMPLSIYQTEGASQSLLLFILRRSATSLQQIHRRGLTVGGWHPNSVFISEEGDVEFIDINGQVEMEQDLQQYGQTFLPVAQSIQLPWVSHWFENLAKGKTHNLDQLRSDLSAIIAEGDSTQACERPALLKPRATIGHCYQLNALIERAENSELWQAEHITGRYPCGLSIYRSISQHWPCLYNLYKSLETLYHPNIEQVIQFGQLTDKGEFFIARAWIEGRTLNQVTDEQAEEYPHSGTTILFTEHSLLWFRQLLIALEYLHSLDIFHGAICPENIICNNRQAVLVNFGIGLDIAKASYWQEWVDPLLWAEEGSAEKDLYGLVASFIHSFTTTQSKADRHNNTPSNTLIDRLNTCNNEQVNPQLIKACQHILRLEPFINAQQSYLQFFGLDEPSD